MSLYRIATPENGRDVKARGLGGGREQKIFSLEEIEFYYKVIWDN